MIFIRQLISLYEGVFVSRLNTADSIVESYSDGNVHEVFVTSKSQNMNDALRKDLEENLGIKGIDGLTVYRNYLIEGLNDEEFTQVNGSVLHEAPVDDVCNEYTFKDENEGKQMLVIESAPGQFDTRVDAVDKNIRLVTGNNDTKSRYKEVITFDGNISKKDMQKIENYLINPNEKVQSDINEKHFDRKLVDPINHVVMKGFNDINGEEEFKEFLNKEENGDIAIEIEDIQIVQDYFKNVEKRNPTKVELLLIGTYWSDHCRHTTLKESQKLANKAVQAIVGANENDFDFRNDIGHRAIAAAV